MDTSSHAPGPGFDPAAASVPRAYNYAAGGKDHFASDRQVAEEIMGMSADAARVGVDNRAFLYRAIWYAADEGVRQFIDIGAGSPLPSGNTHQWALEADPAARVLYADGDPSVVNHLRVQAEYRPQVAVLHGDLRNPRDIMTSPVLADCIDLGQPAAVILGAVLHFVGNPEAAEAVEYIGRGLAPGSFLIVSHATGDDAKPGQLDKVHDTYRQMGTRSTSAATTR